VTFSVSTVFIDPSGSVSLLRAYSTAHMCLQRVPRSSKSGHEHPSEPGAVSTT